MVVKSKGLIHILFMLSSGKAPLAYSGFSLETLNLFTSNCLSQSPTEIFHTK